MKEAIMLLLVLLIGIFTSQSFGYSVPTIQQDRLLQVVYTKVDDLASTDKVRLQEIYTQFPSVIQRFTDQPVQNSLLTRIYRYIDTALYPQAASNYPSGLVEALADVF